MLDQAIDTATPAGRMLFPLLAAIAESEHDLIAERTRDHLTAAPVGWVSPWRSQASGPGRRTRGACDRRVSSCAGGATSARSAHGGPPSAALLHR